ncbi:hypothetical protein FF38_06575 [Lucilia cuprina]|uniref:Uncharacterized protein n=1 Tax=Lucilia cuprina TaxID=7375 RepID=A0A0L0CAG6_LUCCU|nr:hypothetical protein FF38_06575 [Lucilia cuprina]
MLGYVTSDVKKYSSSTIALFTRVTIGNRTYDLRTERLQYYQLTYGGTLDISSSFIVNLSLETDNIETGSLQAEFRTLYCVGYRRCPFLDCGLMTNSVLFSRQQIPHIGMSMGLIIDVKHKKEKKLQQQLQTSSAPIMYALVYEFFTANFTHTNMAHKRSRKRL